MKLLLRRLLAWPAPPPVDEAQRLLRIYVQTHAEIESLRRPRSPLRRVA